jgi:hypothetical protein
MYKKYQSIEAGPVDGHYRLEYDKKVMKMEKWNMNINQKDIKMKKKKHRR